MQPVSRLGPVAALLTAIALVACEGDSDSETLVPVPATATRPQLEAAQADNYTIARYLAQAGDLGSNGSALSIDNWTPPAVGDVTTFTPNFTVAADGSGTHATLQAAIDAVPAATAGAARRYYILVKPGTYREVVCANGKAPITLYGTGSDASRVVIVAGNYNGLAKAVGASANPCNPSLTTTTYGTSGSASVAIYSNDFHARNVTFANDAMKNVTNGTGYPAGASGSSGAQAVALMTQADRLVFENVRVVGHQDSLYVKTINTSTVSRAYFRDCHVEGDVDFVFGRGTMVLDHCTIRYVSTRLPVGQATAMLAPSTSPLNGYGMLVTDSTFTADAGAQAHTTYLGRAWDEGVNSTTNPYVAGTSPNGQLLIRNSTIGAHVRVADPWAASTSGRDYSAQGNRLAEYLDTMPAP